MGKLQEISGYMEGSGNSPHCARADHTHEGALMAVKKTIKATDWEDKAAEVPFEEGTYIGYQVDAASLTAADTAVLVFDSVGTKKLNFSCTTAPTDPIDVYVLYL